MTDKATVELPSPVAGTIARLGGEAGDVVAGRLRRWSGSTSTR